jgi:hypothetical protein
MTALSITDDFFINFSETTTLKFAREYIHLTCPCVVYHSVASVLTRILFVIIFWVKPRSDIFESLMGAVYLSRGFYTAMPLYQNVIIPAVYAYAARFETKQES